MQLFPFEQNLIVLRPAINLTEQLYCAMSLSHTAVSIKMNDSRRCKCTVSACLISTRTFGGMCSYVEVILKWPPFVVENTECRWFCKRLLRVSKHQCDQNPPLTIHVHPFPRLASFSEMREISCIHSQKNARIQWLDKWQHTRSIIARVSAPTILCSRHLVEAKEYASNRKHCNGRRAVSLSTHLHTCFNIFPFTTLSHSCYIYELQRKWLK